MFMAQSTGHTQELKLMYYESKTKGWVLSQFGSPCTDDVCFFGYQKERQESPPQKGWVYGAPEFVVNYKPMVYDDADTDPNATRGFHISVEYTPDPNILDLPDLTFFNGRYIKQPRYVHEESRKYMILPIDFQAKRTWALAGLVGVPRKWTILMKGTGGDLYDMYDPPTTEGSNFWEPVPAGLQLITTCSDHFPSAACESIANMCTELGDHTQWVRDCCRSTCGFCQLSRSACKMGPPAFMQMNTTGSQKLSAKEEDHQSKGPSRSGFLQGAR